MKNRKYTRKSFRYKWKMFWYQLTLEDIIKAFYLLWNGILALFTAILMFVVIFIIPHLFH